MAGEPAAWGSKAAIDVMTGRADPLATTRTTYLALLTAAPTDATTLATMSEVSTAGYLRQAVTWNAPVLPTDGPNYQSTNSSLISFGPFTVAMAFDAVYAALVSAASGTTGDFIFYWALDVAENAAINETIQIPAGKLILAHN